MLDFATDISENLREHCYIDGRWVAYRSSRRTSLISPVTEREMLSVPLAAAADVDHAVASARAAFDLGCWPRMAQSERAGYLRGLADALRARLPQLAQLWTAQVGAPIAFADGLIHVGESRFDHFAELAGSYSFEDRRPTPRGHARVVREPVGVAALIAPWNATYNIFANKIAAALAAGCTIVLKSPPESPFDALVVAECAHQVGFPSGVVNVITADRHEAARLVASPLVDKVSFTGSVATGRLVARSAAETFTRTTLELGGKSAAILLDDVDLGAALPALAPFTMPFSGQICFAQTRILAPRSRLDDVVDAYSAIIKGLRVGDPWDPDTQVGPVLNARQFGRVLDHIETGRRQGARLVLGGGRSPEFDRGYFVAPTVFSDVSPDMTISQEEIFGPVVTVTAYDDEDDAIAIANSTELGLSGSVFSADPERACAVARRVISGHLAVNGFEIAPNVPFGGRKSSGYGREGGPEGLESFLESKAVFMPGAA